ncbi:MAG: hypothetical protein ACO3A2_11125 [Bdellovibrionia bacterium]
MFASIGILFSLGCFVQASAAPSPLPKLRRAGSNPSLKSLSTSPPEVHRFADPRQLMTKSAGDSVTSHEGLKKFLVSLSLSTLALSSQPSALAQPLAASHLTPDTLEWTEFKQMRPTFEDHSVSIAFLNRGELLSFLKDPLAKYLAEVKLELKFELDEMSQEDWSLISQLRALETLDLTNITDADLLKIIPALKELPHFQALHIHQSSITADSLGSLKELKLVRLDLHGNSLTGRELRALSGQRFLRELDLSDNLIKSSDLKGLLEALGVEFVGQLDSLNLSDNLIGPRGVQILSHWIDRDTLDCKIELDDDQKIASELEIRSYSPSKSRLSLHPVPSFYESKKFVKRSFLRAMVLRLSDLSLARAEFKDLADKGYPPAELVYAIMTYLGEGDFPDPEEAKKYFKSAADHGSDLADRIYELMTSRYDYLLESEDTGSALDDLRREVMRRYELFKELAPNHIKLWVQAVFMREVPDWFF